MNQAPLNRYWKGSLAFCSWGASVAAALLVSTTVLAQEAVFFGTEDPGEYKGLDIWGADTAWLDANNVRRSVIYMGKPQTDVIRFSFTGDWALVSGNLSPAAQAEFDARMAIVNNYTNPGTALYLNNDTDDWVTNPYLVAPNTDGVNPDKWAELIAVTAQKAVAAGHPVLSVSIFNEPDHAHWQGDVGRFGDVAYRLRNNPAFPAFNYGAPNPIRIMGANTLNNDRARDWGYDQLNTWGFLEEGNTHQLAGNMWTYIDFYETVQANGDVGTNDELHNVMEAMVGAEYGMDAGIWWGTAERARGEFVKASDGKRLAYAENRPNWTAASVYRAPGPDGKIQAFVGESERQALPTTYRFVSRDRPVFYDGHGPQRVFDVTTTGGPGYQTSNHHNAERVVNITWGDDVQPVIDGRYILVARHSRKVVALASASSNDGVNIQQNTYSGGALHQQWDVHPLPNTAGGDYSYFSIASAYSGKFPDVVNFSYDDGGDVRQYGTPGSIPGVNQQWFLEYAGDGWFYIRNRWSGKYLDVNGGPLATGDGANIHQWEGPGGTNQQWRFMPVDANPTDATAPRVGVLQATAKEVSVDLTWNASTATDLAGYDVLRSDSPTGPFDIIARGVTTTSYTDKSANQAQTYYYKFRAVDRSLNRSAFSEIVSATPSGNPTLVAHLGFEGNLDDSSGNANNGEPAGSATYGSGWVGTQALVLDGTNYVTLPAEVVNHDELTVAAWVRWNGGSDWQRIFDFGNGTAESLFLTPKAGGAGLRFSMFNGMGGVELNAPTLSVGQWVHVAVTLGATARLYVNGAIVAESGPLTIRPSDFNPVLNLLGDSQFTNDPLFSGSIDDFRIYNYALDPSEVAALLSESATVAYWNFEDGVANQAFTPDGQPNGSGGSTDVEKGILMRGYNSFLGPSWTASAPPNGGSLAMNNADNHQDAYVTEGALHGWSPTQWTIECTVYLEGITGFQTLIGRDGSSQGEALADFYLQNNADQKFRINIDTVGGQRWTLDGGSAVQTNTWYALAAISDGSTLSLWMDDGTGYQQIGSLDISAQSVADNALPGTNLPWTFGRGWYNGGFVDHIDGRMDNIRFSAVALAPQYLIPLHPVPSPPAAFAATVNSSREIGLSWIASTWASTYNVKRSSTSSGPYTTIGTGITGTSHNDSGLTPGTTYYYVVSAENTTGESTDSAEDDATTWTLAEGWRFAHFGTIANSGDAADDANPDGDLANNKLERAFAGDPNVFEKDILPKMDNTGPLLSMVYRKALAATDLTLTVQENTTVSPQWNPATGSSEILSDDGTVQLIRFTRMAGGDNAVFLRVEVTGP